MDEFISDEEYQETNCKISTGGDFNVGLKLTLDCSGRNVTVKNSVKFLEDLIMEHVLVDVLRVRNPESKNLTWRQKNSLIQRRLDYLSISDSLQDDVAKTDIITAINTDHLAVVLGVDSLAEYPRGPSFWKFNNSLLHDSNFVQCMRDNFPVWLGEISYCEDLRIQWGYIKYNLRKIKRKKSKKD